MSSVPRLLIVTAQMPFDFRLTSALCELFTFILTYTGLWLCRATLTDKCDAEVPLEPRPFDVSSIDKLQLLTILGRIYRVGHKSKRLILNECVNKTEKIGGMWTNTNIYRENGALSDIFTWNILRRNCFMFKYILWLKAVNKITATIRYDTTHPV